MINIDKNSFEAINLFVIYICFQDGKVSKEEASEIVLESSILKHYYFECYGEICDLDMESVSVEMQNMLTKKFKTFTKKPTELEIEFFDDLISDFRLRDIALMAAKLSASKDGLHEMEESKWNFWLDRWTLS
tara:strand:+ start:8355 stop:8750 length:396 start_codon:yes stop_codon:yes gene_type:complete